MRNSESLERSEGVAALRRRFLIDLAWPVSSDLLCHMFGLIQASPEVRDSETQESDRRMRRLADNDLAISTVVEASKDASQVLALVENDEERVAWLATFALAIVNVLEDCALVEVTLS